MATEPFKVVTREESWKKEVNESIVTMLEDALKEAKEGQYTGIALAIVLKDGSILNMWSKREDNPSLMGAVLKLGVSLAHNAPQD